jgi:membrane protease YdiL (CAAX protease family)
VPLGLALWIAGRDSRRILCRWIRLPRLAYLVIALAIPIAITLALTTGQYLVDRADWAAHNFGRLDAPQFASYFGHFNPWLLLNFFSAFFEEIIFRGLLQPRFLQRYGLYRGIFLVGIIWAAFHFASDFAYSHASDLLVLSTLFFRLAVCLVLGYVFGWLTLRSQSILPAAVAHTFYNVLLYSQAGTHFPGESVVRDALWGVVAYLLFRYWPVPAETQPLSEVAPLNAPEPAD